MVIRLMAIRYEQMVVLFGSPSARKQWTVYRHEVPFRAFPISFKKGAYGSILTRNSIENPNETLVVEELYNDRMIIGKLGENSRSRYDAYSLIYGV